MAFHTLIFVWIFALRGRMSFYLKLIMGRGCKIITREVRDTGYAITPPTY